MSFSNLERKILKIKNVIQKESRILNSCHKCKRSPVPKGYKNCIKCCLGNSVCQYKKLH